MNFLSNYRYAIAWALFILFVCGVNGAYIPSFSFSQFLSLDKIAHMVLFWVLTYLTSAARRRVIPYHNLHLQILLPAFVMSVLYGVLIEMMQATVFVNRSFDYADMLANTLGCVVAWLYITLSHRNRVNTN